ncbi:MAG: plasmid recombination protein, partial [Eubacteriales bacterium]|nr:plasmid recombination protein [Eubacteriales bacterium]
MGGISFTAHVSSKSNGIISKAKLSGVAKHNLRKYKSNEYSDGNIVVLHGSHNLLRDVKQVYRNEFDEALKEYNAKQDRPERKIENYFEHVANKKQDMAVEIIIQVGDKEYWEMNRWNRRYAESIYSEILDELKRILLGYIVANAVVHLDEDSPHMHVVGVPVATGYTRGLSKQVSKRRVFTKEVLSEVLQGELRESADKIVQYWLDRQLKEKSKGHNHDLTVAEYKAEQEFQRYERFLERNEEEQARYEDLQCRNEELDRRYDELLNKTEECEAQIEEKYQLLDSLEEDERELSLKAEKAAETYDIMLALSNEYEMRDKMLELMWENEKLKRENSKLKETLNKAYDFMKQVVIEGRNMLD